MTGTNFLRPGISILMANFNNARYISSAIDSVLRQTCNKWELIIVDDSSTDNSIEVISHYLHDKRIKLLINECNKGVGFTKKRCAENANGEIIGILDPDDVLDEKYVQTLIKAHKDNPEHGVVYFPHFECDENLHIKQIPAWVHEKVENKSILENNPSNGIPSFKKEVYDRTEGFDISQKKAVDQDLIYKLEEITRFKYLNIPLYYYRIHENGISQGKSIEKAFIFDLFAKHKAYKRRLNTSVPNISRKEMINILADGCLLSLKNLMFSLSIYFLIELIKLIYFKDFYLRKFKTVIYSSSKR